MLESDSGYIELLLPGETSGVAGTMYLSDDKQVVSRVEVQIEPGQYTAADPQPGFGVENLAYLPDEYFPKVTGIVNSPYKQDASNVKVNVLAYDKGGKIIGGGFTFLNFVPAGGSAPVDMSVTTSGAPATLKAFAALSGLSSFGGASSSAPDAQNIKLLDKGFGRDGEQAGFAFIVENPNTDVAVTSSAYQVALYGPDGAVVQSEEGYIELLLPGQKLGVAGQFSLPDKDTPIDRIEAQIKPGKFTPMERQEYILTDKATYIPRMFGAVTTGVVKNPYSADVTSLRANAVAYDDQGAIIGGGFTFLDFVPAGEETGVSISTVAAKAPARVEIYAAVSGLSSLTDDAAAPLELALSGFGQQEGRAGFGFLVKNPDAAAAVDGSQYHATTYAADGSILATDAGYISLLLPGEQLGVAGSLSPATEDAQIDRVVVQVRGGDAKATEARAPFATEEVAFVKGSYSSQVTGRVVNPYDKDAKNLRLAALAYDAAGNIIGGGFGYLEFVPAGGKAAADVSVTVGGTPAKVELYAAFSGLSDLE